MNTDSVMQDVPSNDIPAVSVKTEVKVEKNSDVPLNNLPFPCDLCNKSFKSKRKLRNHKYLHRADNLQPFVCDVCSRGFPLRNVFMQHWLSHYQVEAFPCDRCDKRFITPGALKRHQDIHTKKYMCHQCDTVFPDKNGLTIHNRKHSGDKPFKCTMCDKRYADPYCLRFHEGTHFNEATNYVCKICSKAFKTELSLRHHFERHNGRREKLFPCLVCNMHFSTKTSVRFHYRSHTGERPYECDICGKTFKRSHHLNSHNKTHNKDKTTEK